MEIILNPDAPTDFSSRLPDEIVLEILSKLIDLKSLCFCKLVSRRFNRIVNNVDTVSFSFRKPSKKPFRSLILKPFKFLCNMGGDDLTDPFDIKSFCSAYMFMHSFSKLRDLCIQLPTCLKGMDDHSTLFKWKVNYRKNKVDSFLFLSPNSVYDKNGFLLYRGGGVNGTGQEVRDNDQLGLKKLGLALDCFSDMLLRIWVILNCTVDFPLLEKVSVTHSDKKGTVSLGGEKLAELMKSRPYYPIEYLYEMLFTGFPSLMIWRCYVPLLELPVSGYVMKEVTLILMTMAKDHHDVVIDRFINNNDDDDDDDIEDKVEAAYNEAMMQILKKRMGLLVRVDM